MTPAPERSHVDQVIERSRRRAEEAETPREFGEHGGGDRPIIRRRFTITAINNDTLTCTPAGGGDAVTVAKHWDARRTPFDGETVNGYTYTYSSATARQSDDGSTTEDQVITPPYFVGAQIVAERNIAGGTGVTDVIWEDVNKAGRAWAEASA
jgi:hypothetical protein